MNEILDTVLVLSFLGMSAIALYCLSKIDDVKEDTTHHDNRPGSYYYESQRALREKREEAYGNK